MSLRPKLALVGCGAAAERLYVPLLGKSGELHRQVETIAVDVDLSRAERIADLTSGVAAASVGDAADMGAVAAVVATPLAHHASVAIDALECGLPVVVEKPLTATLGEAEAITKRASDLGLIAMTNNNRRLFPASELISEAVRCGEIGQVESVRIADGGPFGWPMVTPSYLAPGALGVLSDRGAHTIDLLHMWLDEPLRVVSCRHDGVAGPDASCILHLEGERSGANCELRFSRLFRLDNMIQIDGTAGRLESRLFAWNAVTLRTAGGVKLLSNQGDTATSYETFVARLLQYFLDAVLRGSPPPFTATDVLPSIRTIEDAYAAASAELPEWLKVEF